MTPELLEFDDPAFELRIATPAGDVTIMGNFEQRGGTLIFSKVHVHGPGANLVGIGPMIAIAQHVLEIAGAEVLVVEGFRRHTGSRRGRQPPPITFRRRKADPSAG